MIRRDFELIARVIKTTPSIPKARLAVAFANELQQTNSGFKRDKFIRACGVQVVTTIKPGDM